MVVTFIEEKKKQKRLIYLLLAVLIITGFILWQGFFKKPPSVIEEPSAAALNFEKAEIDFTLLENPILKELQPFERIEPFEEKVGRENPFLPY